MMSAARSPEYRQRIGILLLLAGVVVNPVVLGMLFAPDGTVDGERRIALIVLVQVFCLLAGLSLAWKPAAARLGAWLPNPAAGAAAVAAVSLLVVGTGYGIWAYQSAHSHTMDMSAMQPPTAEEQAWADDFVRRSFEAAQRNGWFDFEKARADGFQLQWDDREHFFNRDFLYDGQILDPDRPEFLMYQDTPRGKLLMGYMYFTRSLEERGPTPGGSLTMWHFHPWGGRGYCAENGLLPIGRPDDQGNCATGIRVSRSAEMLHVWFVDHPLGPFADAMVFPSGTGEWNITLLHPIAVHFTLGLFIVGVLLDLAGRLARVPALHTAAFVNLVCAAVAAAVTIAAGMAAEVKLLISHDVHQVLDTHKLLGFSAFGGILLLLAWRLTQRGEFPARAGVPYLALGLLTAGLATGAGYYGSELVYVHGVGVQAIDRQALERLERTVFGGARASDVQPAGGGHVHGTK